MIHPSQYMSIGFDFKSTNSSGYTVSDSFDSFTILLSGSPTYTNLFGWGLCDPVSGQGNFSLNSSANDDSRELLQISNFKVMNYDQASKKFTNKVTIDLIHGATFTGFSAKLYLMANDRIRSGALITFMSHDPIPEGLQVHIYQVGDRSNGCTLGSKAQSHSMTYASNTV